MAENKKKKKNRKQKQEKEENYDSKLFLFSSLFQFFLNSTNTFYH